MAEQKVTEILACPCVVPYWGQRGSSLNEGWSPALTNPAAAPGICRCHGVSAQRMRVGVVTGMFGKKTEAPQLDGSCQPRVEPRLTHLSRAHPSSTPSPRIARGAPVAVATPNTISVFEREIQILWYILNNIVSHEARARQTWLQTPALSVTSSMARGQ